MAAACANKTAIVGNGEPLPDRCAEVHCHAFPPSRALRPSSGQYRANSIV